MQSIFAKTAAVFLAIAAAIALPAAVSAQTHDRSEVVLESDASVNTLGEQIGTETNYTYCFRIVGYGICCW